MAFKYRSGHTGSNNSNSYQEVSYIYKGVTILTAINKEVEVVAIPTHDCVYTLHNYTKGMKVVAIPTAIKMFSLKELSQSLLQLKCLFKGMKVAAISSVFITFSLKKCRIL